MNDLTDRIVGLSPAKRALLELRLKKGPRHSGEQTIPRRANRDSCPLSFSQQRLWFLAQLEPDNAAYNQPKAIRLKGSLNREALKKTLDVIVGRHEALRTTFPSVDGYPVQVVGDSRSIELPIIDLSIWPSVEREAELKRHILEITQRPFDLSRDLMLRAALFRLAPAEHVLLLVTHHIASDGWSSTIFLQELAALYKAYSTGRPCPLQELPIQYADFAVWQREWLQGEVLTRELSYWKQQLSGAPAVLELPTDRPRPTVQSSRGARQSFRLPNGLTEALKELSRRERVTLFMTLLAAFQTLLYRYTGQKDIVVGSPIAGRTRVETESLIGFFVNTLVLRTEFSSSLTFRQLMRRVREVALGAYTHQDLPFERLVEELQPDRNRSHTPLFQVMFALQNVPRRAIELPGLTLTPLEVDNGTAKFDLFFSMVEEGNLLRGSVEYDTDLFEDVTISRVSGHFQTLLEGIVANPDQRLSDLPLLTDSERQQLLVEWNNTKGDYPKEKCIHELFEAQAEKTPEAVAVIFEDQQLTYRELSTRANQLAHHLQRLGVGPDVLVGICVEPSLEVMVGILGILKAGGAYVPLDPAYPQQRLAFMVTDCQMSVLLSQERLLARLPANKAKVVCLDADWELIARETEQNPVSRTTPENLAYVIYTSGSTGTPKGVLGLHRGTINRFAWMWQAYPFKPEEVCCQKTSLNFVDSIWELFGPLLQGIPTVIVPGELVKHTDRLLQTLAVHRVTRIVLVPSLLRVILDADGGLQHQLPTLKNWISSGESFPVELARRFRELLPHSVLLNLYGSSEASADVTWFDAGLMNGDLVSIPIGRPIANTQIYLLDAHLQPVPVGVAGEVYVGGDNLARGYHNRPDLTAEKFIPNPFADDSKARLYKTGDLARYLPDGNIELIGRKDFQVKIRGFRVELGEIEAVLGQHPTVQRCVILMREDIPSDKRLVAYVVPHDQATKTAGELRNFLKGKLPEYMVPSAFVFLDTLPLTPNGKVDRRALPAPDQSRPEPENSFVAPRDLVEVQLTKTWERILGVQSVGVKDNFFDLGGHSLLAVRLLAQIQKIFGKNLPLATLFQAPTVEQLASILRREGWSTPCSLVVPFQPYGSKPPFFCHGASLEIARHVDADQPFYGLQPHGQDGRRAPSTVEEMAADYIKQIRTIQPHGPYFLGGYSFGGIVAFEMAQQLQKQGEKVALLALLDPTSPRSNSPPYNRASLWANLAHLGLQEKLTYVLASVKWRLDRIKSNMKMMVCRFYLGIGKPLPSSLRMFYFFQVAGQSRQTYVPQIYPGRIILLKAVNCALGWHSLAAEGLEIHEVSGQHTEIIRGPYVKMLAEELRACLEKAHATVSEKTVSQVTQEVRL